MTAFRPLTLAMVSTLFASAPVVAQTPLTYESLGRVLRAKYPKEVQEKSDDATPRYYSLTLNYTPPKSKETLNWSIGCSVHELKGQSTAARIGFNCQTFPADADAGRLRALLEWSGAHGGSRAYFRLVRFGNQSMLTLVMDVPAADVTEERLPQVIDQLFQMAYETSTIWGGDARKPIAKAAAVTEKDLLGGWSGKVFFDDKEVGEYTAKFDANGTISVMRINTKAANPMPDFLTGTFKIADGKLRTRMKDSAVPEEVYEVALEGKTLTLTMRQGKVLKIVLGRDK